MTEYPQMRHTQMGITIFWSDMRPQCAQPFNAVHCSHPHILKRQVYKSCIRNKIMYSKKNINNLKDVKKQCQES